jgi:hypothetical protein
MPSLAQRAFAEWLGTAFLLAAVVGSGIMAEKLAGGNGALALLCNTLPTGAILVVLILTFGPISGAHFNPAVSLAFALRGELSWSTAALYMAVQVLGGIAGVWAAHLMFELPVAIFDHRAHGARSMAGRSGRHLRPGADDLRLRRADAGRCALRGRSLHHGRLLVHRFNVVRQSRRDDRALIVRYLRRHRAKRRAGVYRGAARRHAHGRRRGALAVADRKKIGSWSSGFSQA